MKIRRSRLAFRSPLPLLAAFGFIAVLASPAAAQAVVKGPAILDHAIGKLAVANMALLFEGKFDESMKWSNREYDERYAALPADRKKRMAATMKEFAVADAKFRTDIQRLGVLTIDGNKATLTLKESTDHGGGVVTTSGLEQRFTFEDGVWKVAP